jgi:predicted PurR-regulated permease PerM
MIIKMIKKNADVQNVFDVHAYIIFFAILAGMTSFGFWGIVIGPAVTTIFLTLLYIYSKKS